jgi:hypothetical protein
MPKNLQSIFFEKVYVIIHFASKFPDFDLWYS